jgi:hypothetical protein
MTPDADIPDATGVARAHGGELDLSVIQWGHQWVTLLTTHRRGRPVAVAVEVGPTLGEDQEQTEKRLRKRLAEWARLLPDDPPEILAKDFRTLPLGAFMKARAAMVRGPGVNPWGDPPLRAESRMLAELADALIYVRAAEQGRSPTEAIAEAWGITTGSARGRIGRARARGYLTDVGPGNHERSTLTSKALEEVPEEVIAQHLPAVLREQWRKAANQTKRERHAN